MVHQTLAAVFVQQMSMLYNDSGDFGLDRHGQEFLSAGLDHRSQGIRQNSDGRSNGATAGLAMAAYPFPFENDGA